MILEPPTIVLQNPVGNFANDMQMHELLLPACKPIQPIANTPNICCHLGLRIVWAA